MSKNNKSGKPISTQNSEEIKEEAVSTENPVVDETKSEEKHDSSTESVKMKEPEVKKESKPQVSVTHDTKPSHELKVGDMVTLRDGTASTVTGTIIPVFAFKNLYRIEKILTDRIIIVSGTLRFAVKSSDVDNAK